MTRMGAAAADWEAGLVLRRGGQTGLGWSYCGLWGSTGPVE